MTSTFPKGVGINLRLEIIDEILEERPQVDFLEIIPENWFSEGPHHLKLEKLRSHYPISFHSVSMNLGGLDPINLSYLEKILSLKKRYSPFHLSDHLCFQVHKGIHHHDLLPFPTNQENLKNISERIHKVQDFFKETILIENLSSYIQFEESELDEAEFISQLASNTDCKLLVDINNFWINSQNFNFDFFQTLEKLPWNFVKEIHVAGGEKQNQFWVDTHGNDIGIHLLEWIHLKKDLINSLPVLYERDQNIEGLNQFITNIEELKNALYH